MKQLQQNTQKNAYKHTTHASLMAATVSPR